MRHERLGNLSAIVCGGDDGHGGGRGPVLVLLHGFGAPADDLVDLADSIPIPSGMRLVFPGAPLELPQLGPSARAWWMVDLLELQIGFPGGHAARVFESEPSGLAAAREQIGMALDVLEQRYPSPAGGTILGGFSQGAILAADVAFRTSRPLGGLVLLSGMPVALSRWKPGMLTRQSLPVFHAHGRQDPLLPFGAGERLRDALHEAGLVSRWHPFDGGHGVAPSVCEALGTFLAEVVGEGA